MEQIVVSFEAFTIQVEAVFKLLKERISFDGITDEKLDFLARELVKEVHMACYEKYKA